MTPVTRPGLIDDEARRDAEREQLDAEHGADYAAPEPLRRPVPPAAPYPLAALGDILGPTARRIHEVVQAPDAVCGQAVLAAASLAAQAHANVVINGRPEPLSLWCVTIAESGERKSAVDAIALDAHRMRERNAAHQHSLDMADHKAELEAYEEQRRRLTKKTVVPLAQLRDVKNAIEAHTRMLGSAPPAPLQPWLLIATPTLEGLHRLYRDGQPSLGLFHDDAGEFIGGYAMGADHRMRSAAGLSHLWDRGEFDRVRAADGAAKYYGRRLALHLMMQPVIAETILSDDLLTGQGFLARALLAWPTSTIGTRQYVAVDLSADPAIMAYRARVAELLARPAPLRAGTRNELEPRPLSLAADAARGWIEIHDAIESDMLDGSDYASVRPWAAKAAAQVLRVAGVLTLVADPDAGVIRADTIDQAAELVRYALGEAARIVGTAAVPPAIRHAEALLAWCHAERRELLHSGAALRLGPAAIRTRRAFDAAIAELERSGWAIPVEGGCEVDGAHRRRVWTIWGC